MMNIIKKIQNAASNRATYRVGLLQTKAYRILKQHTSKALEHYDISSVEWAFLGLLYDNVNGLRLSTLATELGVEAPFVTQMTDHLKKTNFLEFTQDKEDSRAKILTLTSKGREFVEKTEVYLRAEMKPLLQHSSAKDIISYLAVLQGIINNSS